MTHQHASAVAKMGRQLLDHEHRAMLPTGAAYGDRQITAVVTLEGGQPFFNEGLNIVHQMHGVRLRLQEIDDRLITAR